MFGMFAGRRTAAGAWAKIDSGCHLEHYIKSPDVHPLLRGGCVCMPNPTLWIG